MATRAPKAKAVAETPTATPAEAPTASVEGADDARTPGPLPLGATIRVRIGGTDSAPEWRVAEVCKVDPPHARVFLTDQYDRGLDPGLKRRASPARSGEALIVEVTEGDGIAQFQRIP